MTAEMRDRIPTAWTKTLFRLGLALMALGLFTVACDDSPTDGEFTDGDGTARLSVFLTDAPGDVANVWVEVTDVVLVGDEGQVSLLEEPTDLINLLELQDRAMTLVEDAEIEAGTYGQLRFIVGGAVLETKAGAVHIQGDVEHPEGMEKTGELKCPSCSQTGIKVTFSGGLEFDPDEEGDLLLDFDVKQSFGHQAGRSGMWIMRPVIHARLDDDGNGQPDAAGEIAGTVALGTDENDEPLTIPQCGGSERTLEEFVPTATTTTVTDDEGNFLTFTGEADEDGELEIEVLEEDTYDLGFDAETVFDTEKLVWEAEVEPAQATIDADNDEVTGVAYTITSVSCEAVSP